MLLWTNSECSGYMGMIFWSFIHRGTPARCPVSHASHLYFYTVLFLNLITRFPIQKGLRECLPQKKLLPCPQKNVVLKKSRDVFGLDFGITTVKQPPTADSEVNKETYRSEKKKNSIPGERNKFQSYIYFLSSTPFFFFLEFISRLFTLSCNLGTT